MLKPLLIYVKLIYNYVNLPLLENLYEQMVNKCINKLKYGKIEKDGGDMEFNLNLGMKYKQEKTVTINDTAATFGSGAAEVFATPMMIGLMEGAAMNAVKSNLPEGHSTVGISVNIKHLSATAVGKKVWAEAELVEIDRKRLVFKVDAYDEDKKIGEGTHERFIIDEQKFMDNLK